MKVLDDDKIPDFKQEIEILKTSKENSAENSRKI